MKRTRGHRFLAIVVVVIVAVGLFLWRLGEVNARAPRIPEKYYSLGETYYYKGSFLWDRTENTEGYSLTIEEGELMTPNEYIERFSPDAPRIDDANKSVVAIKVTIENKNNKDGYIDLVTMGLRTPTKDDFLQCDSLLFEQAYGKGQPIDVLKLQPNTSMTVWIPFSLQTNWVLFSHEISRVPLKPGLYQLLLSNLPTQSWVDVPVSDA